MLSIRDYRKVESLEEAWELNQKKGSRVMGGMLWLKMGNGKVRTAIDLSGLGLDVIEENENEFRIGCMVTLRQLELHKSLQGYSGGAVREALRHIVGVQFRNLATVGGSIFGRFGFSDVLTVFLAMDSYVELYRGGIVPLEAFTRQKRDNDILVRLIVKKRPWKFAYQSVRNTTTDFPVLTCAGAYADGRFRVAVGARPGRAVLVEEEVLQTRGRLPVSAENGAGKAEEAGETVNEEKENARKARAEAFGKAVSEEIVTGSNMRGSAAYRKHLAGVLVRRVCLELGGAKEC